MISFTGNILIIGCGAVAQCTLPLLFKEIDLTTSTITIIDPVDNREAIRDFLDHNVQYNQEKISRENYPYLLAQYLKPGDICIDLANKVDTYDILSWCHNHSVMYLNTCLNQWESVQLLPLQTLYDTALSLSNRYDGKGPTSILSHGANPGLISSFAKQALVDHAQNILKKEHDLNHRQALEQALATNNFKTLAFLNSINVIHITEHDTQEIAGTKKANQFLNTWSVVEFMDECIAMAEFAWGTHEKIVPKGARLAHNNIHLKTKALDITLKSWLPDQEFYGIIPPHDEAFTIADYLTLYNQDKIAYRPTVIFVYNPCTVAKQSLKELKSRNFKPQEYQAIITTDIISGRDSMGCLLISSEFCGWWTGSLLSIEESNRITPGHNATVLQVAAGVISALLFMINNPYKGIFFPEQLDHKEILARAKPYLGLFISQSTKWSPTNHPQNVSFHDFITQNSIY